MLEKERRAAQMGLGTGLPRTPLWLTSPVCKAMAPQSVGCSLSPRPTCGRGDAEKPIPSRCGSTRFLKRPSPILSWALMQKSLRAAGPPAARRLGWGTLAPAHCHLGGCAHSRLGPCKKRTHGASRDVSALSCSSEAHAVSTNHGQALGRAGESETGGSRGSWTSQAAPGLRGQPHRGPSAARGLGPTHVGG